MLAHRLNQSPAIDEIRSTRSYMVETHQGGRVERVPGFDVGRVMAQGFGGRRLPVAMCSDALASAGDLQFAFPQNAIGKDDRVPVVDPTQLPWRCICHLVIDGLADAQVLGTGWMAGPRTVFTAGHNVFNPNTARAATRITVIPGRRDDFAPFNFFRTSKFAAHDAWIDQADPECDLAAIWLDAAVGHATGWFGYASKPDAQLDKLIVNTAGYPADKRIGSQWFNAGRISTVAPRVLEYGLDTESGQSGSPIFAVYEGDDRVVLAVHAYGGNTENRGVRITDDVFALFQSWVR